MSSLPPPPEARPKSKPIWKRWWFWVIAVLVALYAIGVASRDTEDTAAESPSASVTTESVSGMPDLVGLSIPDALQALEAFGIHMIGQTEQLSRKPEGTVLSQDPPAGSEMSEATFVTVVVAKPFPRVPDVTGQKLTGAKRTLKRAGFSIGQVTERESGKPKGTVLAQTPAEGKSAKPGTAVGLVVAKPKPTPTSTGGSSNCTPGYSPCLPPASDYDCAGGSGDGPKYTGFVRVTGSDPYGLDADNDGYGCE
jgi:hypothetical protein